MYFLSYFRPAALLLLIFTLITGVLYPAVVTVIAQVGFSDQANGSLIKTPLGESPGSRLIGQEFSAAKYFWGRPSATTPYAYNAAASSGSNLGPTNPALLNVVALRIKALHAADPSNTQAIPVDLVTASGSGLDPHISVAAALYQIPRIAKQRHLDVERLQDWVAAYTEARQWGIWGEPRVNVLQLNLALDADQQ